MDPQVITYTYVHTYVFVCAHSSTGTFLWSTSDSGKYTNILVHNTVLTGIGKTHYVHEEVLKVVPRELQVTIPVNEAFSTTYAIEKLRKLPYGAEKCVVFFNFTILQPLVS